MSEFLASVMGTKSPKKIRVFYIGKRAIAAQFFDEKGEIEGPSENLIRSVYPTKKLHYADNPAEQPFYHGMMSCPMQDDKLLPDVAHLFPEKNTRVQCELDYIEAQRATGRFNKNEKNVRLTQSYMGTPIPRNLGSREDDWGFRGHSSGNIYSKESNAKFAAFCAENIKNL